MRGENPFDVSAGREEVLGAVLGALARLELVGRRLADGSIAADVRTPSGTIHLAFQVDSLGTLECVVLYPFTPVSDLSDTVVLANLRLRFARLDFDQTARRIFLRAFLPLAWAGDPHRTIPFLVTALLAIGDLLYAPLASVSAGLADRHAVLSCLDSTRAHLESALAGPGSVDDGP